MLVQGAGMDIRRSGGTVWHSQAVAAWSAWAIAGCRSWSVTGLMIVCGAILAALAPHSHHPILTAAAGLVPLFILARIGRVGVALAGGALWGVSLAAASVGLSALAAPTALAAYAPAGYLAAIEYGTASSLPASNLMLMVLAPALFASFGAWLTRQFGFSAFVLGVTWYVIECGSAALGHSFTAREYLVLEGAWYHSVAAALGYTFIALMISWLTGTVVTILDATVRAVFSSVHRFFVEVRSGLPLRSFDEFLSFQFLIPSLAPRAPPSIHCFV